MVEMSDDCSASWTAGETADSPERRATTRIGVTVTRRVHTPKLKVRFLHPQLRAGMLESADRAGFSLRFDHWLYSMVWGFESPSRQHHLYFDSLFLKITRPGGAVADPAGSERLGIASSVRTPTEGGERAGGCAERVRLP